MADSPKEIADQLVEEHGITRALQTATEGTTAAQHEGDNYALSIWREVKRILHERSGAASL